MLMLLCFIIQSPFIRVPWLSRRHFYRTMAELPGILHTMFAGGPKDIEVTCTPGFRHSLSAPPGAYSWLLRGFVCAQGRTGGHTNHSLCICCSQCLFSCPRSDGGHVHKGIDMLECIWLVSSHLRLILTSQWPLLFPTSVQSEDAVVEAASLKRSTDNGDNRSRSGSGLQGACTSLLLPFLRLTYVIGSVARHRSTICRVSAGSLGLTYGSSPPSFSDTPSGAHASARADGEMSKKTWR